jgi:hypothetical protein
MTIVFQNDSLLADSILTAISNYQSKCKDLFLQIKNFDMTNDISDSLYGKVLLINDTLISELTPYAEGQLLGLMKIPAAYFHRCPGELKIENFKHWKWVYRKTNVLARTQSDICRGIVSSGFNTNYDDYLVFPLIMNILEQSKDQILIRNFSKTESLTSLSVLFSDLFVDHEGKQFTAGVQFLNSEIGRSSLWIKPIIHMTDWIYPNFLFSDKTQDGSTAIRHIGKSIDHYELFNDYIKKAQKAAQVGIYQLLKAEKEEVINPVEDIKKFGEQTDHFTKNIINILTEEFEQITQTNKLHIAMSMLKAIKELPLFNRTLAEQEVGRYLNLFENTEERFEQISQDLLYVSNLELD